MGASAEARLANLLGAAATGLTDRISEVAAAAGLDVREAVALVALLDFSPAGSVQSLSSIVGLTHAGGVRLVDRLAEVGYVQRRAGDDRRSVSVELTADGRRTAQRLRDERHDVISAATTGLGAAERAQLMTACERLVTNLTNGRLAQRAGGTLPAGGALCRWCDFNACGRPAGRCPAAVAASRTGEGPSGLVEHSGG